MAIIQQNDVILFQGDSITDCGRREDTAGLGNGYPAMIQGLLPFYAPSLHVTIKNRGISADRTVELLERWKEDCEDIAPNILSIKIGVNDVWRILGPYKGQTYVEIEAFRENYRKLLDRALAAGVRQLVLCSPTTIENGKDDRLRTLIQERVTIVKNLAREYRAVYVPFYETQEELLKTRPENAWTLDGCHPSTCGHAALAHCWLSEMTKN